MGRAVFSGNLNLERNLSIPVGIYKSYDQYGIESHRYHEECGGKIRMQMYCEEHPNEENPVWYSGVEVGDNIVRIEPHVKDTLFDRDVGISPVGVFKENLLRDALFDGSVVPINHYWIRPKPADVASSEFVEATFNTFLHRLKVKNLFMLVTVPLDGMNRYAAITNKGVVLPFCYDIEIRDNNVEPITHDKVVRELFDSSIEKLSGNIMPASFSGQAFQDKVSSWIKRSIVKVKEKVSAN